jgi:polyisoprenoid-binding protein YceI
MHKRFLGLGLLTVFFAMVGAAAPARAADDYTIDPMHSGITFRISHLGLCWIQGRFNNYSGDFTIDPNDAGKCSFSLTIRVESIDTNNPQRDTHLRSPDFFNAKQFPAILFKSTSVKAIKDGYEVAGELTMHGVAKPVRLALVGGGKAEFPRGVQRTGYTTELIIKRSEFGVGGEQFAKALGDDVHATISFEGSKK